MGAPGPWAGRQIHFVGVGGAGLSAYARAASALGASVTGSDEADSPFSRALAADGVLAVAIGHSAQNLPAGAGVEVICSAAIPADNPERVAAERRGLTLRSRAALVGELSALRRTIAVAGAHGKTTTSSMIASVLRAGGLDPGYLIGGILAETGRNGDWGSGEWLVIEADESDRSLLSLHAEIAVLTNAELDHHDAYGSLAELEQVYREFLAGAPDAVIWDRAELLALREGRHVAYDVAEATLEGGRASFYWDGVAIELALAGIHNARNAAAALSVARLVGVADAAAAAALSGFRGAARRFERLGESAAGAQVYDDYAHHPTEIAATLAGARTLAPDRLIAVFQPHLYSRTRALAREFGAALAAADAIVVLEVYAARERASDFPGVSGLAVAEASADAAAGRPVYWMPERAAAEQLLSGLAGAGDLLVLMGAGDVDELGRRLIEGGQARA